MMNFFEAMSALQNGRKVRRLDWKKEEWIGLKEQQFKLFGLPKSSYCVINEYAGNLSDSVSLTKCIANDWEEFKEPKE